MKTSNIYTQEQIKRVLVGAGVDIEAEFGNDYIIFCPYHNNNRTPAGEVAKDSGLFFCFGCQTTKNLEEFIMHMSGRTYFEAVRYIKSKETEHDIERLVNNIGNCLQYLSFSDLDFFKGERCENTNTLVRYLCPDR